jgi:formate hydrogenlyase subunit 6/NADH:ubiquinone oxidoreductase subunit I
MHKFSYFQDRLGYIACVGCGRCARACPADMNLVEHLKALVEAV